jgi:hypothetical protein
LFKGELNKKDTKLRTNPQFQRVDLLLHEFSNKFPPTKANAATAAQQQPSNINFFFCTFY